jgi:hypothetical protein
VAVHYVELISWEPLPEQEALAEQDSVRASPGETPRVHIGNLP